MPLSLIDAQGKKIALESPQAFEEHLKVRYTSTLCFENEKVHTDVKRRIFCALKREWVLPRQKWLGAFYADPIREGAGLDLTVRWIDETIRYGVWTNRLIAAKSFVGTYTGLVRKRRLFKRWQNNYCFIYHIGEGRRTSYTIDAEWIGNYTRFFNHCDTGNLEATSVYSDGLMHILFFAPQEIPAGTQLLYDYGPDYWTRRRHPTVIPR